MSFGYKSMILLSIVASTSAFAGEIVETRIHDVIAAEAAGQNVKVLSTSDARVYEVAPSATQLISTLMKAKAEKAPVAISVEGDEIRGAKALPAQAAEIYHDAFEDAVAAPAQNQDWDTATELDDSIPTPGHDYQATNLPSMDAANRLFDKMAPLRAKAQCFQRAEAWVYELYNSDRIYSMKVFLFFTRTFTRYHSYKWWFHVAPYVYVQGQEIVLDPQFVDEVRTMQSWTDFFMMDQYFVRPPLKTSPICKTVASYKEYEALNGVSSDFCLLIKAPMYYYQPLDLENLANDGTKVTYFRPGDLKGSKCAYSWWCR